MHRGVQIVFNVAGWSDHQKTTPFFGPKVPIEQGRLLIGHAVTLRLPIYTA